MLKGAAKLLRKSSYLRIDLYEVDGKVYFEEMMFTLASGWTISI